MTSNGWLIEMTTPRKDARRGHKTDAEENPGIPAAYTYLGQLVDHDLTLVPHFPPPCDPDRGAASGWWFPDTHLRPGQPLGAGRTTKPYSAQKEQMTYSSANSP